MTKVDVTLVLGVVDLGEDEEFGYKAHEDYYFVVKELPPEFHSTFLEKVGGVNGLSEKEPKKDDGKLRIDWSAMATEYVDRRNEITEIIQNLIPNAKVRHRTLGSGLTNTRSDENDE